MMQQKYRPGMIYLYLQETVIKNHATCRKKDWNLFIFLQGFWALKLQLLRPVIHSKILIATRLNFLAGLFIKNDFAQSIIISRT